MLESKAWKRGGFKTNNTEKGWIKARTTTKKRNSRKVKNETKNSAPKIEDVPFGGVYVPYFYSNAMYVRRLQQLP